MIEFYKDGDAMAIRTDAATDSEFLDGCSSVISEMIEKGLYGNDWEFQLGFWLPQIVDIACSLRGYKSEVVTRTMRSTGSSFFVGAKPTAVINERKEVHLLGSPELEQAKKEQELDGDIRAHGVVARAEALQAEAKAETPGAKKSGK